jgi:hypothetical protein
MSHPKNLPYELHTNRELELMLAGTKPVAYFYDVSPAEPSEEIIPEQAFAPFVMSGTFIRREWLQPLPGPPPPSAPEIRGTRYVFFALPAEEWRIDELIALKNDASARWSEAKERREGSLLGYEEWQNDAWIAALCSDEHTREWYWVKEARREARLTKVGAGRDG